MNKIFLVSVLAMTLASCGDKEDSLKKAQSTTVNLTTNSHLIKFMDQKAVCDVISTQAIHKLFNSSNDVKTTPSGHASKHSNSVTCNYSWDSADIEQRKEKMMTYMVDNAQGKAEKRPMREIMLKYNFSVRLEEYNRKPESFIPPKLTEEQLQNQISAAKQKAAERLTDQQKKIAGKAANSMMENLLRQNNENISIAGIGDAAYWTAVGGGSLNVLSGNIKLSISPMIADTAEDDIQNARSIADLIIQ
jgi:hypothetical protein